MMSSKEEVGESSKLLANCVDPFDFLNDDCLDNLFKFLSEVDLIRMKGVSKLWNGSIDWRLGNYHFQKKYFPEFAAEMSSDVNTASRDELSRRLRRNVFIDTMRTKSIATSEKRFQGMFYNKYWPYKSWTICGDYFVWVGETHLNIQRISGMQGDEIQHIQKHPLHDYHSSPYFSAIRPETCGFNTMGEPLLALVLYEKSNPSYRSCPWKLSGRVTVLNVVTGSSVWGHKTENTSTLKEYTVNINILVLAHQARNLESSWLEILDIQTGKKLLQVDGLSPIAHEGGPESRCSTARAGIWAHPHRNLLFCTLLLPNTSPWLKRMGILCADTGKWVGIAEIPSIKLSKCPYCSEEAGRINVRSFPHGIGRQFSVFGCPVFGETVPESPENPETFCIQEFNFLILCNGSCSIRDLAPFYTFRIPPQGCIEGDGITDLSGAPSLPVEKIEIFNVGHLPGPNTGQPTNSCRELSFRMRPFKMVNPFTRVLCGTSFSKDGEFCQSNLKLMPQIDLLIENRSSFYTPEIVLIRTAVGGARNCPIKAEMPKWTNRALNTQALTRRYHVFTAETTAILMSYEPTW